MKYIILMLIMILFSNCAKTKEQKALKIEDDNITIRLEGIVLPSVKEKILANATGYISEIFVHNGDTVKKGDLLYKINQKDLLINKEKLQRDIKYEKKLQKKYQKISSINISAIELKKIAFLKSKGYINDFEENKYKQLYIANLAQLKNDDLAKFEKLKTIQKSIDDKEFKLKKLEYSMGLNYAKASADGFIVNLNISKNQLVNSGTVVCNILNIDNVIIDAGLASGLLPFIHKKQKVKIDFVTSPPYSIIANITRINPIVDPKFQTMTVSIKIKNKDYLLQNGTRALITVYLPKEHQIKVRKMFQSRDTSVHIASDI